MMEDNTPFSEQNKKNDTQHMWNAAHPVKPSIGIPIVDTNARTQDKGLVPKKVSPLPPNWPYLEKACTPVEADPKGLDAHAPGAKLDAGKLRPALVLGGFANAINAVVEVGTKGAEKYSPNGWREVEGGVERYTEAMGRHWLRELMGETEDPQWNLLHAAHLAWNALARLELMLQDAKK